MFIHQRLWIRQRMGFTRIYQGTEKSLKEMFQNQKHAKLAAWVQHHYVCVESLNWTTQ